MQAQLNRILRSAGLATTSEPFALCAQLGYLVRDHAHFLSLLVACDPPQRRDMYEALRPHLRFVPKALDVYLAEAAMDAAARQLPVMGDDGKLHEYTAPEVFSGEMVGILDEMEVKIAAEDTETAQAAVAVALAKEHLHLTCRKCTKAATFDGTRRADCVEAAREAGWGYDSWKGGSEICPNCLK